MQLAHSSETAPTDRATLSFAPLGVPLRVSVEPQRYAASVAAACLGWEGHAEPGATPIRLNLTIVSSAARPADCCVRVSGSTMRVAAAGAAGRACAEAQAAECSITPDWLARPGRLREEVIEPLVLFLLTRPRRTPIHASGFVADGLAVLLAGRSGSGKSCLARAADAAGLQVLSEDTIYIEREPEWRVWGRPEAVHLLPEDAAGSSGPRRLRNGRLKHVVGLRSATCGALSCRKATLCVLEPGTGQPSLTRLSRAEALARLWPLDPGFDLLEGAIAEALAELAAKGAWRLALSADPAQAIRVLCDNLPLLRETAAR